MEIAIVGLGWLGLPLGEHLRKSGYRIIGTTTSVAKKEKLSKQVDAVELLDFNQNLEETKWKSFFENSNVLILNVPPRKLHFQTYVTQCESIVKLIPASTKVVFVSSTSVYKDHLEFALEDSNVLTDFEFQGQLFQAEKALQRIISERLTILRFAGLIGPNRSLARFFAGKKEVPNGQGVVNLVHLQDCIRLIESVIKQDYWGETFNVCASSHPTRSQFYSKWCAQLNQEIPQFKDEKVTSKMVSNQKSKQLLSFEYEVDNLMNYLEGLNENNPS